MKKYLYVLVILQILIIAVWAQEKPVEKVDVVTLKEKNEDVKCRVIKDDITGVAYYPANSMNKTVEKRQDEVAAIKFYDTPAALESARSAGSVEEAIGFYDTAINELKDPKTKSKYRAFHMQYALYGKADANVKLDKYAEAISSFRQLLVEVQNTKFKKDAYLSWLDCCSKLKSDQAMKDLLNDLKNDKSDIAKNMVFNVQLAMADMLFNAGKYAEALAAYKDVETNASLNKDAVDKALMGQFLCLEAMKKAKDLDMLVDTINTKKDVSPYLITVVYTYKGDMMFKAISTAPQKDKTQYMDALMLYLKAISLGFPSKEVNTYYQRALFNAADCYKTLAEMAGKQENTADKYKKQAAVLLEELKQNYPESELGKKAREILEKAK